MRCKIPNRDLAQKLDSTICRYKSKPVLCRITTKGDVALYDLERADQLMTTIAPTDEDFDVSGVPLGCIQSPRKEKVVFYLSRMPWRRTKQGLQHQAVVIRRLGDIEPARFASGMELVYTKQFVDMVMGKYPPLATVLTDLRRYHAQETEKVHQIAVSIEIALSINPMGIIYVYFKNQFVGWMPPDSMTVLVPHSDKAWIISKFLSHELTWKVE